MRQILLGGVDMAGHSYGSGKDPDEWDTRNTPDDLSDDISRSTPTQTARASSQL